MTNLPIQSVSIQRQDDHTYTLSMDNQTISFEMEQGFSDSDLYGVFMSAIKAYEAYEPADLWDVPVNLHTESGSGNFRLGDFVKALEHVNEAKRMQEAIDDAGTTNFWELSTYVPGNPWRQPTTVELTERKGISKVVKQIILEQLAVSDVEALVAKHFVHLNEDNAVEIGEVIKDALNNLMLVHHVLYDVKEGDVDAWCCSQADDDGLFSKNTEA